MFSKVEQTLRGSSEQIEWHQVLLLNLLWTVRVSFPACTWMFMNMSTKICLKDTKYKLHNMFGIMAAILERSSWLSVAKLKPLINSLAIRLLSQSQTIVKPKYKPKYFIVIVIVIIFSLFAHYELTLNPFCQHCSNKILTLVIFVIRR